MKLVNPKFEEIDISNPLLHGEMCTRVCYKSENLVKEGSAKKLLTGIAEAGHTAMLEHIPVYIKIEGSTYYIDTQNDIIDFIGKSPYSKMDHTWIYPEGEDDGKIVVFISTNLRVVYEHYKELYDEIMEHDGEPFDFEDEDSYGAYKIRICRYDEYPGWFKKRITIKFTMDRIGSQSFCRHRVFSFAQESTRWCNYMKDKFGSEISISTPCWLKEEDKEEFEKDMKEIEQYYFKWLNKGYKGEEARYFLPFGLKTEIIMTGFVDAWEHFFSLRVDSHAHSQARELAIPLYEYFKEKKYII